jgi:hypothetical protein
VPHPDHVPSPRDDATPPAPASGPGAARRRADRSPWNLLLLLPLAATLLPWFYNRTEPALGGVPFFYWFQLAAIGIGVVATVVAYRATRGGR